MALIHRRLDTEVMDSYLEAHTNCELLPVVPPSLKDLSISHSKNPFSTRIQIDKKIQPTGASGKKLNPNRARSMVNQRVKNEVADDKNAGKTVPSNGQKDSKFQKARIPRASGAVGVR